MHKTYLAKKVSHHVNSLSDPAWGLAQVQRIEEYPWKGEANPYSPEKVEFRVLHDGHNLYVRFDTWEEEVRATYTVPNDPVCRDRSWALTFPCRQCWLRSAERSKSRRPTARLR